MANSVWTAPAWSDWGWGLLFSLFGPPRGQARKMTRLASVGVGRGKRSAAEPAPSYLSIRTKPLLLVPRFSASAPLHGFRHAAWWARPSSPRPDSGKYPIRGLEGAFSARGADERSEERKAVWGKPCDTYPEARDLQAAGVYFRGKKAFEIDTRHCSCFCVPKSVF